MFKIRCSQIAKIMTNPRSKSETLSETTKSYLETWLLEQIYNRRKDIKSKYLSKGNVCEYEAIQFVSEYLNMSNIEKNEQFFENNFLTGTPDIITNDCVIDIKNSWDFSTFPLFEKEALKDYVMQVQGYMELTGLNNAKVIYILSDTPENLIEREAWQYCNSLGFEELENDIFEDFVKKMTYSDIPAKHKIKVFDIAKDDEFIKSVENRVKECNEYIKGIWEI